MVDALRENIEIAEQESMIMNDLCLKPELKMIQRGNIIERIESLPEECIREVADFIEFLEAKRKS